MVVPDAIIELLFELSKTALKLLFVIMGVMLVVLLTFQLLKPIRSLTMPLGIWESSCLRILLLFLSISCC